MQGSHKGDVSVVYRRDAYRRVDIRTCIRSLLCALICPGTWDFFFVCTLCVSLLRILPESLYIILPFASVLCIFYLFSFY